MAITFADGMERAAFFADIFQNIEDRADDATVGLIATVDAFLADNNSDPIALQANDEALDVRAAVAGAIDPSLIRSGFVKLLRALGEPIDARNPAGDVTQLLDDLWSYMDTNSETVNSREIGWGSVSGSTTGDGEIVVLHTDEGGYEMEGVFAPETYTWECVQDSRGGAREHEEVFEFYGTAQAPDPLERTGSGAPTQSITSLSASASKSYLFNPSFNSIGSNTAPTASTPQTLTTTLPGWTINGAVGNFDLDLDVAYRSTPGESASYSLAFTDNDYLHQELTRNALDFNVPYVIGVSVYRASSADGTLTIRLTDNDTPTSGGVSRAITVSSQTNATWSRYWLVATPGQNNWPSQFNADSLGLTIQLSSNTTGKVHVDDVIFAPMTRVAVNPLDTKTGKGASGFFCAIAGGPQSWVRGDTKTVALTESTRGEFQFWWADAGLGYLPSTTGGTETVADK